MKTHLNPRAIANALLQAAIKITPPSAAEWGQAMLAELHHVEGDWSALAGALGAAGLLAKQAALSALIPGHANQLAPSNANFFTRAIT